MRHIDEVQSGSNWPDAVPRVWETFLDTPTLGGASVDPAVVLVPVPYDSTTSFKPGARDGPRALINASKHLEDYDLELERDISRVGIATTTAIEPDVDSPVQMFSRVQKVVEHFASQDKLVGLLGGEHSITIGAVNAQISRYPELSILYLDAHADMRNEYMGSRWSHACVARRLSEQASLVEVGVRSISESEKHYVDAQQLPVLYWPNTDLPSVVSEVVGKLSHDVYISIDLDVLDPSIMAAVGTPEPGGMVWEEVTDLLKQVALSKNVVGFDVVELSPNEGPEACSFTAAKLVYKLIGYATS